MVSGRRGTGARRLRAAAAGRVAQDHLRVLYEELHQRHTTQLAPAPQVGYTLPHTTGLFTGHGAMVS